MRRIAPPPRPENPDQISPLFAGIDWHQLPVPAAVATHGKEGNDIIEFALARGASAGWTAARYPSPVIDVYSGGFKEVKGMRAVGARVLLKEAAQDELTLLLDSRKVPPQELPFAFQPLRSAWGEAKVCFVGWVLINTHNDRNGR
jgi:hypothetical protein